LDPKRLVAEIDEIDRLQEELEDIILLRSCEVDILADGRLDLPDSVLKRLDFTVCAIHYRFELDRKCTD
jgi:DNA polymerase (family 10)